VAHKSLPLITENPQKSQQSNMIISLSACNFLGAGAHDEVAWYTINEHSLCQHYRVNCTIFFPKVIWMFSPNFCLLLFWKRNQWSLQWSQLLWLISSGATRWQVAFLSNSLQWLQ